MLLEEGEELREFVGGVTDGEERVHCALDNGSNADLGDCHGTFPKSLLPRTGLGVNISVAQAAPVSCQRDPVAASVKMAPGSDTDGGISVCLCSLRHFRCFFVPDF